MYELWQWEDPWKLVATFKTAREAHEAGKATYDPPDICCVAKVGSQKAQHMRDNAADHDADLDAPYS